MDTIINQIISSEKPASGYTTRTVKLDVAGRETLSAFPVNVHKNRACVCVYVCRGRGDIAQTTTIRQITFHITKCTLQLHFNATVTTHRTHHNDKHNDSSITWSLMTESRNSTRWSGSRKLIQVKSYDLCWMLWPGAACAKPGSTLLQWQKHFYG
jgi:hypothetical protein